MPRLIDAYKVRIDRDDFDTYSDYFTALDAVTEAPTVDAVPVIRCKECKYYTGYECQRTKVSNIRVITNEDDYCSRAERKDNG